MEKYKGTLPEGVLLPIINTSGGNNPSVESQFAGNTVWLTNYEMARLFNVFVAEIDSNLRHLFKEAQIFHRFVHSALREHLQKDKQPKISNLIWLFSNTKSNCCCSSHCQSPFAFGLEVAEFEGCVGIITVADNGKLQCQCQCQCALCVCPARSEA